MMDVEAELKRGIAHQNGGALGEAARCYRNVLAADPAQPDALHLMSGLASLAGDYQLAMILARQSIAGAPDFFAPYISLGNACHSAGQVGEAAAAFLTAAQLNPRSAEALCNLSNALNDLGRHEEAVLAAARAVSLNGDLPEARNNLGNALLALGSVDEAAEAFLKAVTLSPSFAQGWFNLGKAMADSGDWEGAERAHRAALSLADRAETRYNLANTLAAAGKRPEAEAEYRAAMALAPADAAPVVNLSTLLVDQGRLDDAETLLRQARQRIDDPELGFNLSLVLLRQGRMEEGWREYEWRWEMPSFQPYRRDFGVPAWDGTPLAGRTLLVHAEQGFGDALQFARFIPEVVARGGPVVLECRPGLERLFASLGDGVTVVTAGTPLPQVDLHVPLMSLPARLGTTLDTLPARCPYLFVPADTTPIPELQAASGLKVGLAWAGSPTRRADARRSLPPAELAALLDVPGVSWFSLQVGGGARPEGVVDLAPRLTDFAATAMVIAGLDLVISVDTAVAHLAGALGKPVWVMLSTPCDGFLWMNDRPDSPWYPSARLFRQVEEGDWAGPVARMRAELAAWTEGAR